MISLCIQRSIAGIVLLIITFSLGEQLTIRVLWAGLITGVFVVPLAIIAFRRANFLTNNLGVNALRYSTLLFSVLWIFLFREPNYMNFVFSFIEATYCGTLLLEFEV